MDWLGWVQIGLAITALAVGIAALVPVVWQSYLDRLSRWPYDVTFQGLLRDPVGPWHKPFGFRVRNRTTQTAFFEVRITGKGMPGAEVPFHISVWPSRDDVKLYLEIPPKVWREVRVRPFGPQDPRSLPTWTLSFTEFYHRERPERFDWPHDLNRPIDEIATEIPRPPSSPGTRGGGR